MEKREQNIKFLEFSQVLNIYKCPDYTTMEKREQNIKFMQLYLCMRETCHLHTLPTYSPW